jgi:hypothetical protein
MLAAPRLTILSGMAVMITGLGVTLLDEGSVEWVRPRR